MLNSKTSNNSLLQSSLDTLKFLKPKKINSLKFSPNSKDDKEKSCELYSKNEKDCSDIKSIVKKSVEKINYLFNLKEMQEAKIKKNFSPKKTITVNHSNNILTNKFSNKAFEKTTSDTTRIQKRNNSNYFKDKNKLEYCDTNSNNNINSNELSAKKNKNKNSFKEYSIIVNKKLKPNNFVDFDFSLIYKSSKEHKSNNERSINGLMNLNNLKKEKKYTFSKKNKNFYKNKQKESKTNKKMYNFKSCTKMLSKNNMQNNFFSENKLFYRTGDNFANMIKSDLFHDDNNSYSSKNIINTSKKKISNRSNFLDKNTKKIYIQRNMKRPANFYKYHRTANKYSYSNIHRIIRQAIDNPKTKKLNNLYSYKTDAPFSKLNSTRKKKNSPSLKLTNNKINNIKEIINKKFPNKVYTNTILKIFLLLNEYLLNNNLLTDININNKRIILNNFTKYLISYMKIDYPSENEINDDKYINAVRKIQRVWREKKIRKFLGNNLKENEIKKMVVNRKINKIGFKMKKILSLFNSIVQDFTELEGNDNLNEMFYLIKKIVNGEENSYEKNKLFKEYINNVIYLKG